MTFGKRRNKTRESFVPDSSAVERAITSLERMLGDATVSGGSGEYGLLKMIVNEYRLTRSRLESVEGQLPEWITYDASNGGVLTIHGRRYSAAMFGEAGFLSPPGTLLRVEAGPDDVVTLSTAGSLDIVDAVTAALDEWLGPLSEADTERACDAIRRVLVESAQGVPK
jgi:hypothetical protein